MRTTLFACLVFVACSKGGRVDRSGEAGITAPRQDSLPRPPAFVEQAIANTDLRAQVINVREWQWIEVQNHVPRAAAYQHQFVPGELCGTLEGGTFTVLAYREYQTLVRYDQPAGDIHGGSICPSGAVSVVYQDTP